MQSPGEAFHAQHHYSISPFHIADLSNMFIFTHSTDEPDTRSLEQVKAIYLEPGYGLFAESSTGKDYSQVSITLSGDTLSLACSCNSGKKKLCSHQARVLFCLLSRKEIRLFFDAALRREALLARFPEYGLDPANDPEDFFRIRYEDRQLHIEPLFPGMIATGPVAENVLQEQLFPQQQPAARLSGLAAAASKKLMVLCRHRYSDQLNIELMEAATGKDGQLKGSLARLDPVDLIWYTHKPEELRFYAALLKIKNEHQATGEANDLRALRALIRNPLSYGFYHHDNTASPNITLASVTPVTLLQPQFRLEISTRKSKYFQELTAVLWIGNKPYELQELTVTYRYFFRTGNRFYLADSMELIRIFGFFRQHDYRIMIPHSGYNHFKTQVLDRLEHKVHLAYSHTTPATAVQLAEQGLDRDPEWVIYLSEQESHIGIMPVLRYGSTEIPVLSRKQVYATDNKGNSFVVQRDEQEELRFIALLMRQHPDFAEQLELEQFYLHKERFLDERWFLNAFADWQDQGIIILGFNEIKKNRLNQYTAKVNVQVSSGLNWFNALPEVTFGKQKASLKQLYKSVRNRSKYVQLGDGTLGILPEAWLEKFARYFESGDVVGATLRIPRINYTALLEAYEDNMMLPGVKAEAMALQQALKTTTGITPVPVSSLLKTTLRPYQQEGLNWLAFLDKLGFGACLADDMGLGKTIQVIAFLLHLREMRPDAVHLIVMPTSLIFNWQNELLQFAPDLLVHTHYGPGRRHSNKHFNQYNLILTTYGTLLSDVNLLKAFAFDYVILDESQAIKNPDSERYKAAMQLQSRNRIALTGTPVENNTFDLYGQLSFTCPGLLGNKHYFRNLYALPIDRFGNDKRALALQQKVAPFILRRTKEQVATELPEKTEMILYCPMGEEQRRVYELQEKEIRDFIATKQEEELSNNSMHVLKGLTRLRQICNATTLISKDKAYGDYSSKISLLIRELEQHAGHHKVLIFSQFVSMLELIRKELEQRQLRYAWLSGQTKDREQQVQQFKEPGCDIFLISLKAGGTGLNLTEADYVYLVDPWWNPAVENQAIDRSYRIGQQKHVMAIRLICPDTVEEKIRKLQTSKQGLADNLVQTGASVLQGLGKEALLNLLS